MDYDVHFSILYFFSCRSLFFFLIFGLTVFLPFFFYFLLYKWLHSIILA